MKKLIYRAAVFLLLFFINKKTFSQDYQFKSFTTQNGLSTYNTRNIIQDKFGFIWIATQDGLNRFDGFNFINITQSNDPANSLGGSFITDCKLDKKGLIWVSSDYGGIDVINPANVQIVYKLKYDERKKNGLISDWVRSLQWYNAEELWIGTYYGISIYNDRTKDFTNITENIFNKGEPLNANYISQGGEGEILVGIENSGILIFNKNKHVEYIVTKKMLGIGESEAFKLTGTYIDKTGKIYLCTNFGLRCLKKENGKYSVVKMDDLLHSLENVETRNMIQDKSGNYWIATSNGLYVFDSLLTKQTIYTHQQLQANSILDNYVNFVFQDSFSNIWISSSKGVNIVSNSEYRFKNISYNNQLKQSLNHLYSLTPVDDSLVFTSTNTGFYLYNINSDHFTPIFDVDKHGLIDAVYKFSQGTYIISGEKKTFVLKMAGQKFGTTSIGSLDKKLMVLENKYLSKIAAVGDSLLLFGSRDESGLFVWNKKLDSIINYTVTADSDSALLDNYVQNIKLDKGGKVWIVSDLALTNFDYVNKKFHHIIPKPYTTNRLNSYFLMDLYDDGAFYWVTSYGGGVNMINKKDNSIAALTDIQGLSANTTYSIVPENDSIIWVSSNNGLSRINLISKSINQFKYEDGLQSNSFEVRSSCKMKETIIFGGIDGLSLINKNKNYFKISKFPVYFSAITYESHNVFTSIHDLVQPGLLKIPSDPEQVSFSISGIGYSPTKDYRCEYKIKELNDKWIAIKNNNMLVLTGIPTGVYHIEARVSNEPGTWNNSDVFVFEILPKWYQTIWFKILVAFIVMVILYIIYRYRVKQILKVERIRQKLSSDLHDDIGSTLNSVNIYAKMASLQPENNEYLMRIREGVQSAITGVRDIIWILDKDSETISSVFNRISAFSQPLIQAAGCKLQTNIDEPLNHYTLANEEKRNVYLVIKEAMNNCIKYSDCSNIHLTAEKKNNLLIIAVTDDGKGFTYHHDNFRPPVMDGGNGLKNMQMRCDEIKWELSINSALGKGTTIRLSGKIKD
jgi:ligand-binding sensor domain-containing protein/anti-sigma regulatory factor (Ser/Thr protein kinase)